MLMICHITQDLNLGGESMGCATVSALNSSPGTLMKEAGLHTSMARRDTAEDRRAMMCI